MDYYVYILQSASSGMFYKGSTNNLQRRFDEHNNNQEKATKGRGPWNLVWYTKKPNKSEAYRLEMKIKNISGMSRIETFIAKYPCVGGPDAPPVVGIRMQT